MANRSSPFCYTTQPLPADLEAWFCSCPTPTAWLEVQPGTRCIKLLAANLAGLSLLHFLPHELVTESMSSAFLACFHDARDPLFIERLGMTASDRESRELKVLAKFRDASGSVLLDVRFVPLAESGKVAMFFAAAQSRHRSDRHDGSWAPSEHAAASAEVQKAFLEISRATHETATLEALFENIHGIVERLIGAENFYIALVDEREQMLRFAYQRDEIDLHKDRRLGLGVTDIVYLTGKPLLLDRARADHMLAEGTLVNHGVRAQVWLGVPLIVSGKTVGVMAVQDYRNPHFIGEQERQIFSYISDQIANAIAIKRAEADARLARKEAERASQAKSEFLAVMSHELRTPLSTIIGLGDQLRDSLSDAADIEQASTIGTSGRHLLGVIDHVLNFSKVEGRALPVHESAVDLEELLLVCQAFFEPRVSEQHLTLACKQEGFVPPMIRTDGQILRQILINLVGNAVKFTPVGGRITIRVSSEPAVPLEEKRHCFLISVEDTGVGIPEEKLSRLFQPFERLHRNSNIEGFGLGLAISQRLAELLGGRITVVSKPGEGSTFTLLFVASAVAAEGNELDRPDPAERHDSS